MDHVGWTPAPPKVADIKYHTIVALHKGPEDDLKTITDTVSKLGLM